MSTEHEFEDPQIEGDEHHTDPGPEPGDPGGDDVEARARRMGWLPEDEFREKSKDWENPPKWRPADEFVRRAEENPNILRQNYERLETRYTGLERQLNEVNTRNREMSDLMREMISQQRKREQDAYERGLKDLKAKADRAAIDGDTETYQQTRREIDEMEQNRPEPVPEPDPAPDPKDQAKAYQDTFTVWVRENDWYDKDTELQDAARGINARLEREKPHLTFEENLAEVTRIVKERYPHKFGNRRREEPGTVSNPGPPRNRASRAKKTYADLPDDAKAICDEFVRVAPPKPDGKKYTREDYVKEYFGDEA